MANIDKICAKIGFSIPTKEIEPSKQENAIRNALSILTQDGIFAYLIYLESEGKNITWDDKRNRQKSIEDDAKVHRLMMFYSAKLLKIIDKLHLPDDLLEPEGDKINLLLEGENNKENPDPVWTELKETFRKELTKDGGILENIAQMFFIKQILEQMLIYALYRARSLR